MSDPTPADDLAINVPDVALVFEGGGMRASYTAAVVTALLENGINLGWVGGISAGASNTVNYLSRDAWRARESFTDFAGDPQFGSWRTFVRGQGLFNSDYIYRRTSGPDEALPFAWQTFRRNPADLAITAFRCRDGEAVTWTRPDIPTLPDLMARVQASSTMPVVMPPVEIDGEFFVDGALGPSGGIALDAARAAGFRRFFVVLTQERTYRKGPVSNPWFLRRHFRRFPAVADALIVRHTRYNATREELFDLERQGDALLFVPDRMPVANGERNVARLTESYSLGLAQARREAPAWREFLGLA